MTPDPSPAPGGHPEEGVAPAQWIDGEPANLTAASEDALEWLKVLRGLIWPRLGEDSARLSACIAALERHLPAPPEGEGRSDA